MTRFTSWCREHLAGYVPWPPLVLSLIYAGGLFVPLGLLTVLLGRVLPESLVLPLLISWCVLAALGVAFLWVVGWIVANKWDRTSTWAMLKLWWVWLCVIGSLALGSAVPLVQEWLWSVCAVGPLVVLFLVRAHFRRKWTGEVRPLDGTI